MELQGTLTAIPDCKGALEVGHTTLISGSGKLTVGEGAVRNGGDRGPSVVCKNNLNPWSLGDGFHSHMGHRRNDWNHGGLKTQANLDGPL
jgi:hypothetical protein